MKWSFATVGIIVLGIIGVSIIMLFEQLTTTNENDYYLLKEITEAAMVDSIDLTYYRETGDLKIVREKFVENFTRRFAESTTIVGNDYKIEFYDIMETPPKVSVAINSTIDDYTVYNYTSDYGVNNRLSAILEYIGKNTTVNLTSNFYNNPYETSKKQIDYYFIADLNGKNFNTTKAIKLPNELTAANMKNINIVNVSYKGVVNNQGEVNRALLQEEINYNDVVANYYTNSSINNFATNVSGTPKIEYHNCDSMSGNNVNIGNCTYNPYYIKMSGATSTSGKQKIIIKYQVTWSYDEYKYSN